MSAPKSKFTIYMKSGNQIVLTASKLTVTYAGEQVRGLKWVDGDIKPRLMHMDVTQIEAVVEHV